MRAPVQADLIQRKLFTVHYHIYAAPAYLARANKPDCRRGSAPISSSFMARRRRQRSRSENWLANQVIRLEPAAAAARSHQQYFRDPAGDGSGNGNWQRCRTMWPPDERASCGSCRDRRSNLRRASRLLRRASPVQARRRLPRLLVGSRRSGKILTRNYRAQRTGIHTPASNRDRACGAGVNTSAGTTSSIRTRMAIAAIHKTFITPPTKSSAINAQQQPTQ